MNVHGAIRACISGDSSALRAPITAAFAPSFRAHGPADGEVGPYTVDWYMDALPWPSVKPCVLCVPSEYRSTVKCAGINSLVHIVGYLEQAGVVINREMVRHLRAYFDPCPHPKYGAPGIAGNQVACHRATKPSTWTARQTLALGWLAH